MGDTIIAENTDLRGNIIIESRCSVIFSLHIVIHNGDAKYRIQQKKQTVVNITINKITERIESHKSLKVTDDEGIIHLLTGLKCTVIVKYPIPIL